MDEFLQNLKKVVRIVSHRPAIFQSDCRKAGLYQLPSNNYEYGQRGPSFAGKTSSVSLIGYLCA